MSRARVHLWYDVVWPAATGLVTGLGLVVAYRWTGPLMFVVAFAVLVVTVAPVAWSLLTEAGYGGAWIVWRVAPATAVALLGVVGLADVIAAWTFLVAGLALVTSPLLQDVRQRGLRRVLTDRAAPRSQTRRRFDEIVQGLRWPDEDLPPR